MEKVATFAALIAVISMALASVMSPVLSVGNLFALIGIGISAVVVFLLTLTNIVLD